VKLTSVFIAIVAFLCAPVTAEAATVASNIVYVNGIQTTATKLQASRSAAEKLLRDSTNRAAAVKRRFIIEAVYNPMGWYHNPVDLAGCNTQCQDNYELLALKAAEEEFAASFQNILAQFNQSNVINIAAATNVKRYADSLAMGQNSATSGGFVTDATMADTKLALDQLTGYMHQYPELIVLAHSEGNLLADLAWATLAAELGQDARKRVRVVNVANTARFSVSGLSLTHDSDVALAALTILPEVMDPKFKRETPDCHIDQVCDLQLAMPTFKRPDSFSCATLFPSLRSCNHDFIATYLSGDLIPVALVTPANQGVSYTPNTVAFRDRFEDLVYAAAASLDIENAPNTPVTVLDTLGDRQFCSVTTFGSGSNSGIERTCSGPGFGLIPTGISLKLAASFLVPNGTTWNLSRMELPVYLWRGTNSLTVKIRQDASGLPGPVLFTKTLDNSIPSIFSFSVGQALFPTTTIDLSSAQLILTNGQYWTELSSSFQDTFAIWSSRTSEISTAVYTLPDGSQSSFETNKPGMMIVATPVP